MASGNPSWQLAKRTGDHTFKDVLHFKNRRYFYSRCCPRPGMSLEIGSVIIGLSEVLSKGRWKPINTQVLSTTVSYLSFNTARSLMLGNKTECNLIGLWQSMSKT
jgi:hypothetical protein